MNLSPMKARRPLMRNPIVAKHGRVARGIREPAMADVVYEGCLVGETPVRPILPIP
jgi:hypothetical protein